MNADKALSRPVVFMDGPEWSHDIDGNRQRQKLGIDCEGIEAVVPAVRRRLGIARDGIDLPCRLQQNDISLPGECGGELPR